MTRPFPNDPQWLQLSRKLPPDAVIERLLRFGFRTSDIADRFDVDAARISAAARRIGIPPIAINADLFRRNGAPLPPWAKTASRGIDRHNYRI